MNKSFNKISVFETPQYSGLFWNHTYNTENSSEVQQFYDLLTINVIFFLLQMAGLKDFSRSTYGPWAIVSPCSAGHFMLPIDA